MRTPSRLGGTSIEELEVSIRSVDRGESYLSPQVSKPIIDEYLRWTIAPGSDQILTARQNQVLKLIAEGETTKQIALHLNVSVKTVETHRANGTPPYPRRSETGSLRD